MNKLCSSCGCSWPATTEFYHRDKCSHDGLRAACKICVCEREQIKYVNNLDSERRRKREAYHSKQLQASA